LNYKQAQEAEMLQASSQRTFPKNEENPSSIWSHETVFSIAGDPCWILHITTY